MISIKCIPNVFMVTTIFMIILTSVSTKLYQMAKPNEDYDAYKRREILDWEQKMNISEFYGTVHNMDIRNIPEPKKYDYDEYSTVTTRYCSNEFVTLEIFKKEYQIKRFTKAVTSLKNCFHTSFSTKQKDYSSLAEDWESKILHAEYPDSLITSIEKIKSCFRDAIKNGDDLSFEGCFDYQYKEDLQTEKYAETLLVSIKDHLKSPEHESFLYCTRVFKSKVKNILFDEDQADEIPGTGSYISLAVSAAQALPGLAVSAAQVFSGGFFGFGRTQPKPQDDTRAYLGLQTIVENIKHNFTLKELFLAQLLIENHEVEAESFDFRNMFFAYAQTKEVYVTDLHRRQCKSKYKVMDKDIYTSTKMFYMMFPSNYPITDSDANFVEYKQKRSTMINILKSIDRQNSSVYDKFLDFNGKISKEEFKKMTRRRAFQLEPNYITYAMRIKYMSDYLPLPKNLWNKEKNRANDDELKTIMDREFEIDMMKHEMKLNVITK